MSGGRTLLRGVFVTGTDTGIGKTVVSAALLVRYRARPGGIRYWKPIQTGSEQDDDTATVVSLSGDAAPPLTEGVRLPHPVSPHLAAAWSGRRIALEPLVALAAAQPDADRFVVEGAGGVLVPINESALMVDLIAALSLPALVVARSTLGTINHTLLSIEGLRARGVAVAGVVMNGAVNDDNRRAIEAYGGVAVLGQIPAFAPVRADTIAEVAAHLDPDGRLQALAFT